MCDLGRPLPDRRAAEALSGGGSDPIDGLRRLDLSAQKQKQLTLRALVDHAIGLSGEQPVVVIFEDVHWIDPTSQEVLDLLVPEIVQQRILLVITHRPEYRARWSASAHLTTLTLTHLGRNHAAAMVREVAGGKSLPDEVLNQIVARTDGVPLFVEELTKSVLESGLIEEPSTTRRWQPVATWRRTRRPRSSWPSTAAGSWRGSC